MASSSSKRARKEIDYIESEPLLAANVHKTSDWTTKITHDMHIRVHDQEIFALLAEYPDREVHLECIADDAWRSYIDIDNLPVGAEYKSLVDEVKTVYDANNNLSEYYVDTFVSTLFHVMKMNDYPLSINAQHVLKVDIGEQEEPIVSVPEFIIRSRKSKMLVVVEDENASNAKYVNQWKENQVMGDIFVAAHNMKVTAPSEMYAIRIIGTLFTFYKVFISPEYIMESLLGYPQEQYTDVHRYPPPGQTAFSLNALDFCKLEHRKVIAHYLHMISTELSA
ncbi:hypothetical protein BC940DRAFT_295515 [Gongronella butleri]|nr:hypothetical protein BC940DRAFT_295515 [Gongronella butleri]